jgi:hypothetical protein
MKMSLARGKIRAERDVSWAAFQQKKSLTSQAARTRDNGRHAAAVIFRIGNNQFFALANWKVASQTQARKSSAADNSTETVAAERGGELTPKEKLDQRQSLNNTHNGKCSECARDGAWKFSTSRYRTWVYGKERECRGEQLWKNRI